METVAFSDGDGGFAETNVGIGNFAAWVATANVKIMTGDPTADGRTDLALTGPNGWGSCRPRSRRATAPSR